MRRAVRSEQGFALLIVLWSLVLISLLTTQLVAASRTAAALAFNLRAAAVTRAAADGAISQALFHLLATGADNWPPDGAPHVSHQGGATITARIQSLGGTINPNLASTALLAGLFQSCGASAPQARQIAAGITSWRSPAPSAAAARALMESYRHAGLAFAPPGHDFADLSELGAVIGMTPPLLAAARPQLSLFQSGDPDPNLASPVVRRALALSGQAGASPHVYEGNALVVTITAEADGPDQAAARRTAVISITPAPAGFTYLSLTGD